MVTLKLQSMCDVNRTCQGQYIIFLPVVVNATRIKLSRPKIVCLIFPELFLSIELVFQLAFWLLLGCFSSLFLSCSIGKGKGKLTSPFSSWLVLFVVAIAA